MSYLLVFLSPTALTTENVLRVLRGLQWDRLCNVLSIIYSQQIKIEKEFASEDQRRSAAVNFYLHSHPYASWRHIIRGLDWWSEHHKIQHYAEKLTGMFQLPFCVILKFMLLFFLTATDIKFIMDAECHRENRPPPLWWQT